MSAPVARRVGRRILGLLPPGLALPILRGPNRGTRWVISYRPYAYWLGTYEPHMQRVLSDHVRRGSVVYDVGAHVGFFSLLASKLVGSQGQVVAFEPLPGNLSRLQRHIELNDARNIRVVHAAVADRPGVARFAPAAESAMGALSDGGSLEVRCVSLDEEAASGRIPPPDLIKMDIELGEESALRGAAQIIDKFRPVVLMEGDPAGSHRAAADFLRERNYSIQAIGARLCEILAIPRL